MQYEFTTNKVGSMKLQHFKGQIGKTLKLDGVNAQEPDANIILGGVNQLLSIVNFQNQYYPSQAIRVVNQNVVQQQ